MIATTNASSAKTAVRTAYVAPATAVAKPPIAMSNAKSAATAAATDRLPAATAPPRNNASASAGGTGPSQCARKAASERKAKFSHGPSAMAAVAAAARGGGGGCFEQ